jgi:hypothetical protein
MFECAGALNQATGFLAAQNHRQLASHAYVTHLAHQFGTLQRHIKKEPQSGDRRVQRHRRYTAIHAVQLVSAQVLVSGGVRRATQVSGEVPYGTDVGALGLDGQLAHPHVFNHAAPQRGDLLS